MASSSADWVLGVARLISSARTRFAKIGPSWNLKSLPISTLVPRMSAGIRSGVNWTRPNSTSSTRPSVESSLVLPSPAHLPQDVALAERGGQDGVDEMALPDDHLGDFVAASPDALGEYLGVRVHRVVAVLTVQAP